MTIFRIWMLTSVIWTCLPLAAQVDNYQLANLRTANGEERQAWINEESDLLLSKGLSLRTTPDGVSVRMQPQEVAEVTFSQSGRRFQPLRHHYLPPGSDTPVDETRLGVLLLDGPLALYRLRISTDEFYKMESDIPPIVYYLRTENGEFVKLELREVDVRDPRSAASFQVRTAYKDVLRYLWRDWPGADYALRKTTFRDEALVDVVARYIKFKYGVVAEAADNRPKRFRLQHVLQFNLAPKPRFQNRTDLGVSWGAGYYLKLNKPSVDNALAWGLGVEYLRINFPDWPQQAGWHDLAGHSLRLPFLTEYYLTRNPDKVQVRFKGLLIPAREYYTGGRYRPGNSEFAVPERLGSYTYSWFNIYFGVGIGADYARWRFDLQYETKAFLQLSVGYYLRK
jgi:hypothetical protein